MRFVYGLAALALLLAFVGSPDQVLSLSSGAPYASNGSPISVDEGQGDCTACHGSFELNSGTGSVSIEAPATFMPGETIELTITVDNTTPTLEGASPRQGFQVSVEDDAAVAHVGTLALVDDVNTRFASPSLTDYVTHTTVGNAQTSWTINWIAPEDPPEAVTIYAAGNAGNGGEGSFGDYIYTDSFTMALAPVTNEAVAEPRAARIDAVYPNPVVETASVTYSLDRPLDVTVTLFDGVGRVVRVLEEGPRGIGPHTTSVEAAGLAAGTYFVQVRSVEGAEVRALSVAR